jgi:hypothetical protein
MARLETTRVGTTCIIAAATLFAVAVLLSTAAGPAAAYSGCDKYRFGSQEWWFCMSDKDGER